MTKTYVLAAALAAFLPLGACVETTGGAGQGGSDVLATRGNLSPEAIRLQTATQRLVSLEEEQRNAAVRTANFTGQGMALGAGAGGLLGNLQCRVRDGDECGRDTLVGAVLGGAAGGVAGNRQAQRQNQAAATENALQRRLGIAGQQLTAAQQARRQAESIASANQRKLDQLRRQVAAGQASREQLAVARADAQAEAQVIRTAAVAVDGSEKSLDGQSSLAASRNQLTAEEAAIQNSYNALVQSIGNSAL